MRGRDGGRISGIGAVVAVFLFSSQIAGAQSVRSILKPAEQKPATPSIKEELAELIAHARQDLSRATLRERADATFLAPSPITASPTTAAVLGNLIMPVVNLAPEKLFDSWGQPRDGGRRPHRGIDIFAPRGTEVVAVTDGYISFIGNYGKGGKSVWLTSESGVSFYYAHLDRWMPGLYEGMSVRKGETLGYVGNTGNATSTPPHLHFAVIQNDEAINPYPVLRRSSRSEARPVLAGGIGGGTQ